jgi:hypothetical protein
MLKGKLIDFEIENDSFFFIKVLNSILAESFEIQFPQYVNEILQGN